MKSNRAERPLDTSAVLTFIYLLVPRDGLEDAMVSAAWTMARLLQADAGSLGSRLHRTDTGALVSISMWPDRATWEARNRPGPAFDAARIALDRTVERFETIFVNEAIVFNTLVDVPLTPP